VIMLDVDSVAEDAAVALGNYAMRGGTVLLAPGPGAKPATFNQSFAQVAPAALAQPARSQIDPEIYEQCVVDRLEDRVLKELEDTRHGNIGTARFYNWYTLEPSSMHKDATTLLSLSEGAELLVERRIGRGRVLLWTAGLGGDWQAMVVHSAYPVFLSRLLTVAAATLRFPLNLAPGAPIIRQVEAPQCKIITPDHKPQVFEPIAVGPYRYVRYDKTQRPGTYLFQPDAQDDRVQVRYHVAEDRRESDYRPLRGEARTSIGGALGTPLLKSERDLIDTVGRSYGGRPLAVYFAVALLGMLMLEAWLCRRWFA